jgi:hypothetical protein
MGRRKVEMKQIENRIGRGNPYSMLHGNVNLATGTPSIAIFFERAGPLSWQVCLFPVLGTF